MPYLEDESNLDNRYLKAYKKLSLIATVLIGLIGVCVILGWAFDIAFLKSLSPNLITMKPNTALAFIFTSFAIFLVQSKNKWANILALILGFLVLMIGLLSYLEQLMHYDFHIDELLFKEMQNPINPYPPGRMSPITMLVFMGVGVAVFLMAFKRVILFQSLALLIGIFGLLVLVGFTYNFEISYTIIPYIYAAIHTAINFILIAIAILFSNPDKGFIKLLSSQTTAGHISRLLIPILIVLPMLMSYLKIEGEQFKLYDHTSGDIFFIIVSVTSLLIVSFIILYIQMRLDVKASKIEADLKKSEALFRSAMEYSAVGMALLTPAGQWITVNKAFTEITGYSIEEMKQLNYQDITYQDDLPQEIILKDKVIKGEIDTFKIEKRYIHKNGSLVWALLIVGSFYDESKKLLYFIDSVENITDRKKIEAALAESEERWKFALESANQGVWDWYIPEKRIHFSDTWKTMLGYRVDEINDEPYELESRIHPDDMDKVWKALNDHFAGKTQEYQCEVRFRCKDGHYKWILDRGKVITRGQNGEVIRIIGIHTDITNLKLNEERIQRAMANVERSNNNLQQFAYIASHDLQEPLRSITSFVQLLERKYKDKLDQTANEYIGYIIDSTRRMQNLINDLLMYSRVTTKAKPFVETDCNLIIKDVLNSLQAQIKEKDALITVDNLPTIFADETQIYQLFQNLISNGIKFCEKKPMIYISACEETNDWKFAIKDNGIGIASNDANQLFTMFKRLNPASKYPGTGIGLAICKKIIDRHSGNIWIESTLGEGSTFYFTIPKQVNT